VIAWFEIFIARQPSIGILLFLLLVLLIWSDRDGFTRCCEGIIDDDTASAFRLKCTRSTPNPLPLPKHRRRMLRHLLKKSVEMRRFVEAHLVGYFLDAQLRSEQQRLGLYDELLLDDLRGRFARDALHLGAAW
jgi:hypothetical protein